MNYGTRMKSEEGTHPCNRLSQPPRDTHVKATLFARPLLTPVAKKAVPVQTWCIHEQIAFILYLWFAYQSLAAVREAFTNQYPENDEPNKYTDCNNISKDRGCL
jgi:hypothetical protein